MELEYPARPWLLFVQLFTISHPANPLILSKQQFYHLKSILCYKTYLHDLFNFLQNVDRFTLYLIFYLNESPESLPLSRRHPSYWRHAVSGRCLHHRGPHEADMSAMFDNIRNREYNTQKMPFRSCLHLWLTKFINDKKWMQKQL